MPGLDTGSPGGSPYSTLGKLAYSNADLRTLLRGRDPFATSEPPGFTCEVGTSGVRIAPLDQGRIAMSNDPGAPGEHQPGNQGWGGTPQQPQYPGSPQPGWGSYPPPSGPPPAGPPPAGPAGFGGAPYPGGGPAGPQQKGFFAALFDFSFEAFATPAVVRILYIIGMVLMGIGYVVYVIIGFSINTVAGLAILIGGAIGLLFFLALFRISLEFYYAVVRMSEDIHNRR
jgi:hypothetical protein